MTMTSKLIKPFIYLIAAGFISILTNVDSYGQQIPQFSQYMFNPIFINSAYAGYKERLYIQSYYRTQWTGIEGSPTTMALSADGFLEKSQLGIGMHVMSDQIGANRTNTIQSNIAYHLQLGEDQFLSFGLGLGLINSRLDESLLDGIDPEDPASLSGNNNFLYPELRAGLFYYDETFFFSLGAENIGSLITNPDRGDFLIDNDANINLYTGFWLDLSNEVTLKNTLLVLDDFRTPARVDLSSTFLFYEQLWLGLTYRRAIDYANRVDSENLRNSSAMVAIAQFWMTNGLRIGYAYDHQINGISVGAFSTHDVSIGFIFPEKRRRTYSPKYF